MEFMDFPSAVDEIVAIQKKCELLRVEAEEIAKRTEKVGKFLCNLIGRNHRNQTTHNQNAVVNNNEDDKMSWKDHIISDLEVNGKSLVVDISTRICRKKGITDKDEIKKIINTVRTYLARFRNEGFVISEEAEDQRLFWDLPK